MRELLLTHEVNEMKPLTDVVGEFRYDLQWELERYQRGSIYSLDKEIRRLEFWQAVWGLAMVVLSTSCLAVLLYAVLE